MFTLSELAADPAAILDIKEDIRDECSASCGPVTNVILFDLEPDGLVSVKFSETESAAACVKLMAGRHFDGRVVEARLAAGKGEEGGKVWRRSDGREDIRGEEG